MDDPRIDFKFYRDGTCRVSTVFSVEQDRIDSDLDGCDPNLVAHHLTLTSKEVDEAIRLLEAAHYLDKGHTQVERLVGMIFMAGVEYGRKDPLYPMLVQTKKDGL
jgi:predicted GNAT family N-acyltransferase